VESHLLEVSAGLKNEYSNLLITGISLKKSLIPSGDGENKEKSSETIELAGVAVFKKDKMLGWLSPEESRGVSWILNQTKNTVVAVTDPEHGNKSVSVETGSVKAKIKTQVINGMPGISVNVSGKGDIVEEDGSTNQGMSEVKEHVAELLNKKIEDEIKHSLEIIQKEYMVDCLGFAAIVHAQNDGEWESGLKDKWQEIFPQIPVTVSVDINIKSSTLNQEPMKVY
jgi:spore germination protein KC